MLLLIELNIRLDARGQANSEIEVSARESLAMQTMRMHGNVIAKRRDLAAYGSKGRITVPHLLSRLVVKDWQSSAIYFHQLARTLDQDCIAMLDPHRNWGELVGPRAAAWGAFDISHFHRFDSITEEDAPLSPRGRKSH